MIDVREALLVLAHVIEPADEFMGRFVDQVGPVQALERIRQGNVPKRDASGLQARLRSFSFADSLLALERTGSRLIFRDGEEWPSQLNDLQATRPYALWVVGTPNLRLAAVQSVAVVGARAATSYGEVVAREWCSHLSDQHWLVISGGAYGIDAAAHQGVLSVGGVTACVLASGVDVAYPKAHESLLARIADTGLIISESPPGSQARKQRFLTRNRIIAALSKATLVVEAGLRSGTTSTAHHAIQLNRPVLAVPGPVTSPMSAGCHQLINDGIAMIASDWKDIPRLFGDRTPQLELPLTNSDRFDQLTTVQKQILDAVPIRGGATPDALVMATGVAAQLIFKELGDLEIQGFLRKDGDCWRIVRA